ncbi:META domain-containing protein [Falsiroseomonas sp. HW251]|uniref:META domain-containing protein n=1 Tax=Falsiroseomonas sp. HW251 TaxID=3390998 RepID=UPI003D3122B1
MRRAAALGTAALASVLAACSGLLVPAQLVGTSWQLTELRDDGRVTRVEDPTRYTMAFNQYHELALRLDCNRGSGRATVTPRVTAGEIAFDPIATTRAACPPGSLDTRVAQALQATRAYAVRDGVLTMSAPGGTQTVWRRAAVTPPA